MSTYQKQLEQQVKKHSNVFIADTARVLGKVELLDDVSVWFGAVLRADFDSITIGKRTNVQEGVIMHVDHGSPIQIGEGQCDWSWCYDSWFYNRKFQSDWNGCHCFKRCKNRELLYHRRACIGYGKHGSAGWKYGAGHAWENCKDAATGKCKAKCIASAWKNI
jgi:hypothetical protein